MLIPFGPLLVSVAFFAELVAPTFTYPKLKPDEGPRVAVALTARAGPAVRTRATSRTQSAAARTNRGVPFFIFPCDPPRICSWLRPTPGLLRLGARP
jgi:hypothetical protein